MNDTDIALMLRDGMLVMLKLGGPPLLVALFVGLLVALLQAVTQINEATLAFLPKAMANCTHVADDGGYDAGWIESVRARVGRRRTVFLRRRRQR